MKKDMDQLNELLYEYGIVMERKCISKRIREQAAFFIKENQKGEEWFEDNVLAVLSELFKGKSNGERLVKDFERFALKIKMDEEKKQMNEFYGNSYYFRYDLFKKRICAFPYRTFSGFQSVNYTLESYAENYANALNSGNRLEFDLKKAFDKEAAMEFLREKVNFIFETIGEDYEMAEELENLTLEFKTIVATMLEKEVEKQLKKMEKELTIAANA